MALNAAEEETIETLKKWWADNGKQIITVILLVVIGAGGYTFWQNSRTSNAAAASDRYEEILSLAITGSGEQPGEADSQRIKELAQELQNDYSGSVYALYATLFAAQQDVLNKQLDAAEQELQWLLDNAPNSFFNKTEEALLLTANLRLGRVILAKGEAERALDLVNSIDPKTFEAEFAELRGDILLQLNRPADAKEAYTVAQQAGSRSSSLQMKLDDLSTDS